MESFPKQKMPEDLDSFDSINWHIRKWKKKLRQIERLACSPKSLNDEELAKISQKPSIQASLLHYIELLKLHQVPSSTAEEPSPQVEASATEEQFLQQPPIKRAAVETEIEWSGDCAKRTDDSNSSQSETGSPQLPQLSPSQSENKQAPPPQPSTSQSEIKQAPRPQPTTSQSEIKQAPPPQSAASQSEIKQAPAPSQPATSQSEKRQPPSHQKATRSPAEKASNPKSKPAQRYVFNSYSVTPLPNSHSDIVFSADSLANWAVTAGRDASVEAYEGLDCRCRLTGHTQAVNAARLVACSDCPAFRDYLASEGLLDDGGAGEDVMLCVTASEDATLRIWDCRTGRQLLEHYVFASVTALTLVKNSSGSSSSGGLLILTGSSSGKLELWDPAASAASGLRGGVSGGGSCFRLLASETLFSGRVADVQTAAMAVAAADDQGSSLLVAACSSPGELALCQLDLSSMRLTVGPESPIVWHPALKLHQPSCLRLVQLTAAADGNSSPQWLMALADRRSARVKCASVAGTSPRSAVAITDVMRPKPSASSATVICDCVLFVQQPHYHQPLLVVAAFDYLVGASFLQVYDPVTLNCYGRTAPDSNYALRSHGNAAAAAQTAAVAIGRILCLAAVVQNQQQQQQQQQLTLISGGDRVLVWRLCPGAKSLGLPIIVVDPITSSDNGETTCEDEDDDDSSSCSASDRVGNSDGETVEQQPPRGWCSIA